MGLMMGLSVSFSILSAVVDLGVKVLVGICCVVYLKKNKKNRY